MSHAAITLVFLLFAIIMFIWEKLPLGVTSMIVCIGLIIDRKSTRLNSSHSV